MRQAAAAKSVSREFGRGFRELTRIGKSGTKRQYDLHQSSLSNSDPRLAAKNPRLVLKLLQYLANLFVMPVFVIADEGHRGNAINLAEEGMLENDLPQAFIAMRRAE